LKGVGNKNVLNAFALLREHSRLPNKISGNTPEASEFEVVDSSFPFSDDAAVRTES
jgi:hypothetical protein